MAIFQDGSDYVFYDEEGFARRFILVVGAGFYVCLAKFKNAFDR